MSKERIYLEYVFGNISIDSLWRKISTTAGLEEWFATKVVDHGNNFTIEWGDGDTHQAQVSYNPSIYSMKFEWEKEDDYLEFAIQRTELTTSVSLEITDFTYPEDRNSIIELWDANINRLRDSLGIQNIDII